MMENNGIIKRKRFRKIIWYRHDIQCVSFEIQENERIGLVGVNGGGKTTLFRLLTGFINP